MSYYGREYARLALREIGVLDPTEAGSDEILADALAVGSLMINGWRTKRLTINGITRSVYSVVSGTASYTIGSGGTFNQDYPNAIHAWSVIPDGGVTNPIEIPKGRPLTWDQWQQVRVKTNTGLPFQMYFDRAWTAGLGRCYFYPVPNNSAIDVALYGAVPSITTLVAGTQYDLRPGMDAAIVYNLALRLATGRFKRSGFDITDLKELAASTFADARRIAIVPKESPIRAEFVIGQGTGRRTFNVYTGGG